jgi:phasin family protein
MANKKKAESQSDSNVVSMTKKKATPKKKAAPKKAASKARKKVTPKKPATASQPNKNTASHNPLEDLMMKNTAQFDKMAQEAATISRESFEAMTKSYGIMAKGYEQLLRTTMEMSQSAAEKQAELAKQAMSCSSVNEFADMQSKVAQTSFEDMMSSATKLTEMSIKVLTESAEPMNTQMNKAMQSMKVAA